MRIFITEKETDLETLPVKLFEIKGGKAAAASKTAHAALRKANQSVANLKKLPAGTLVIVPDLAGTTTTASTQSVGKVSTEMIEDLKKSARRGESRC